MSCSKCNSNDCSCSNVVNANAEPPFSCAPLCKEDHTQYVCDEKFVTVVRPANAWNVPACGETAVLSVGEVDDVHIGSYIWSSEHGYYEIVSFDRIKKDITIKNNCAVGNSDEGAQVGANSTFIISDPPASSVSSQSNLFPYVAVSFTAPNTGVPTLVTVTTVNGLSVGKNVQIGSGSYLLTGVSDGTTIEIENTGSGITPGTVVEAENAGGDLQYPVVLIDANPCTNDATTQGSLVACQNGILQPFNVPYVGAVLVGTDSVNNKAEFQLIDVPTRTCSPINDCCVTLVPGTTSYVIPVADSAIFTVGDLVQLGSRSDRFTVTEIIDSEHIRAAIDTNPSSIQTVPAGTSVCLAGCCELVSAQLNDIITSFGGELSPCSDFQHKDIVYTRAVEGEIPSGTMVNGGVKAQTIIYTMTNPSTCRGMQVQIVENTIVRGQVRDANVNDLRMTMVTAISYNGAAFLDSQTVEDIYFSNASSARAISIVSPYIQGDYLEPGETKTFRTRNTLYVASGGAASFEIEAWQHGGIPIGIAVEVP